MTGGATAAATVHSVADRHRLRALLLLAPLIFVVHFLEEGPRFVEWFNSHVARGITPELFWTVNIFGLVITVVVVAVEWLGESRESAALVVLWLSFLFFANALLHITGAIADRAYAPGVITAALMYLPFYALIIARILRAHRLPPGAVIALAIVGSLPMFLHGYLIIFRGSRLF